MAGDRWFHMLSCSKCGFNERHDEIVRILVRTARNTGMSTRGDRQSPGLGLKGKQADLEISFSGGTEAYDVKVISSLSDKYYDNPLRRCHPISFGEGGTLHYDFDAAREDGAALHIAKVEKVREYVPGWKPAETHFQPLDENKKPDPEERRRIKPVVISDPLRGSVDMIPLVFEVGGAMGPETEGFLRNLCEATVEANSRGGVALYRQFHRTLCSSISNKMMRAAARNIIRMRAYLVMGNPKLHISKPDCPLDAPLHVRPTNWVSSGVPFFTSSTTILSEARNPPVRRSVPPFRRGPVKVHIQGRADPLSISPSTSTSVSLSTSSSSGCL
jgi:hypothetical protein